MPPKISVVMPVYNSEAYLGEAIDSVLNQTFQDFELIIIDDASQDRSKEIIGSYTDPRIILIINEHNIGVAKSLNKGIDKSTGRYIARMDSDDICREDRFMKQYLHMEQNSHIAVCGSFAEIIGNGEQLNYPTEPGEIASSLFFYCCITHPTVMMRREFLDQHNLRYPEQYKAEDYKLWVDISRTGRISNIPEILLSYRRHSTQVTSQSLSSIVESTRNIRLENLRGLGIEPTEAQVDLHMFLCDGIYPELQGKRTLPIKADVEPLVNWVKLLQSKNEKAEFKHLLQSYLEHMNFAIETLRQVIAAFQTGREILVWGTGKKGLANIEVLSSHEVRITSFVDSNAAKWGEKLEGIPVSGPECIHNYQNPLVIICSMYISEISAQLDSMGYMLGRDYLRSLDF